MVQVKRGEQPGGPEASVVSRAVPAASVAGDGEQAALQLAAVRDVAQLFASSDVIAVAIDASGRIVEPSAAFATLHGYEPEDAANRTFFEFIHPEERATLERTVGDVLARRLDGAHWHRRHVHKSGQPFVVAAHAAAILADSGEPALVALLLSPVRLDTATFARIPPDSYVKAQRLESASRLAGSVAHDLNNVLAVVVACASSIVELGNSDTREDADAILEAAARAASLTKRLAGFARGKGLDPAPVDVKERVASSRASWKSVAGAAQLVVSVDDDLPAAQVELTAIEDVGTALIENAAEAKAKTIRVHVDRRNVAAAERDATGVLIAPGDYVTLQVEDDGIGMLAAVRERLFEPFFTTKPVGSGAGMALASVYGLVRRHGGGIFVDTTVGKGTKFSILLPAALPIDPAATKGAPSADVARHLVIVVDDEPAVGRGIARMIERRGIRAISCTNAKAALEALARAPVGKTLMLCDVVMPDVDGVELAEEARRRVPGLPVLMMSGFTGGIDVTKSGLPLIDKPFDADVILEQLLSLLPPPSGTVTD